MSCFHKSKVHLMAFKGALGKINLSLFFNIKLKKKTDMWVRHLNYIFQLLETNPPFPPIFIKLHPQVVAGSR